MTLSVVTGANRGIGLEFCRQLAARGDTVIGVCRTSSPELDELNVEVADGIDVGNDACIPKIQQRLGNVTVDLLINNAGIYLNDEVEKFDSAQLIRQFEVNSLGPLRITQALLPNLKQGAKVAIITSRMGSIEDNTSGGYYGYRMSKAAVNAAGKSLAIDLRPRGISVIILHPGFVRTKMTEGAGNIDPPESVRGLLARISELTPQSSGSFFHANGEKLPW